MAAELDLFEYVTIRDPRVPSEADRYLIRVSALRVDDARGFLDEPDPFRVPRVGLAKSVYDAAFCWQGTRAEREKRLVGEVLDLLDGLVPQCDGVDPLPGGPFDPGWMYRALADNPQDILEDPRQDDVVRPRWRLSPTVLPRAAKQILLPAYERISDLVSAIPQDDQAAPKPNTGDIAAEVTELRSYLDELFADIELITLAFGDNPLTELRAQLMQALNMTVVLQRWFPLDSSSLVACLKAAAIVELMARDAYVLRASKLKNKDDLDRIAAIAFAPWDNTKKGLLKAWDRKSVPPGFPRLASIEDLAAYFTKLAPTVHPLFVRIFDVLEPLRLRPIGIGDLQIVRDTLIGYEANEIADINNVMSGEHRKRMTKKVEKSEQTFTTEQTDVTESSTETVKDDRATLKSAVETELASSLKANVNASLTVEYKPAVFTASGSLSYGTDTKRNESFGTELARNVTATAVSKVEQRIATSRTTKLSSESINEIMFELNNVAVAGAPAKPPHLSGIYCWVRRRYKAQVYCYGKRLMYEVVIPEPARQLLGFLRAEAERTITLPRVPDPLTIEDVALDFQVGDITASKYKELAAEYELSSLPPPPAVVAVRVAGNSTGAAISQDVGGAGDKKLVTYSYATQHDAADYEVYETLISGNYTGHLSGGPSQPDPDPNENNTLVVKVDGNRVLERNFGKVSGINSLDEAVPAGVPVRVTGTSCTVSIEVFNCKNFALSLWLRLRPTPERVDAWRASVFAAVRAAKKREVDVHNAEERARYSSELRSYKSALDDIQLLRLEDFLDLIAPGRAEQRINEELRRLATQYITGAFEGAAGDPFSDDPLSERDIDMDVFKFNVDYDTPSAEFDEEQQTVELYKIDTKKSARQGRLVQFIEQAFDWNNLSYVMYPYFWAQQKRWLDTASRSAGRDPKLDAFLRAGSIRLLIPAQKGYEAAALIFCASGIPWLGGDAPTITDPLFRSVADEVRAQTEEQGRPVGQPWEYTLPTDLLYLTGSSTALPKP